jgi:hypothetical protein
MNWLIAANVFGTFAAAGLSLTWFALQVEASHRRHLVEWTTDLRLLDSSEFEWLVGELFRREGWSVTEAGRADGPDGNIDLVLTKGRSSRAIVQCKRWQSWTVGVDDVRAFAGTLMREKLPGEAGVFVTLSQFGEQARAEAERVGMTLIDSRGLYERVERARRPEACAVCGSAMLLDRSAYGWWFRCIRPRCPGKRDLGGDPARAVDLLTAPPT